MALWEDMTDTVSEGVCYLLINMVVHQYRDDEVFVYGKK